VKPFSFREMWLPKQISPSAAEGTWGHIRLLLTALYLRPRSVSRSSQSDHTLHKTAKIHLSTGEIQGQREGAIDRGTAHTGWCRASQPTQERGTGGRKVSQKERAAS